ncbi:MAG TPA: crossover junction endodeoxyribonuclease RuvC [Acidimicrobiia bacterium]|nr:crossover junction endodeoxyribonuclease RuvC [Acidimicrobiia bacterium]
MFDSTGPVLGIDPGVSRCGYGAVRLGRARRAEPVAYGVIRTAPADPLAERLAALQVELERLIAELRPAAVAVERVLFQANQRTAMSVGQASGLALAAAARAGVPVDQYSPNEVKLAVTGHGGADKAQVQAMVVRLLRLDAPPRPTDAADALAVALCHSWQVPLAGAADAGAGSHAGEAGRDGFGAAVSAALAREAAR